MPAINVNRVAPQPWVAIAIWFCLYVALAGCAGSEVADKRLVLSTDVPRSEQAAPTTAPDPMALGDAKAPLTLIEFSDYQCPYCKRFHAEVLPALRRSYIDTGKLQLIYKDMPLEMHAHAHAAAVAGRCAAAQGKFWPMNELLYANQDKLKPTLYPQLAATLGLALEPFKACLQDPAWRVVIASDENEAQRLGLTGTPSFLIGRMQGQHMLVEKIGTGFVDYPSLSRELDLLLARPAPKN